MGVTRIMVLLAGIGLALLVGYGVINTTPIEKQTAELVEPVELEVEPVDITKEFGSLGDEHAHALILVGIFGDQFDFSVSAYQSKSDWIHLEGKRGDLIHRHASGVPLGFLFDTLGIGLTDECYILSDGRQFCTDESYSLKFYINREQIEDITNYVINQGDRILISYGDETEEEIEMQLFHLEQLMTLEGLQKV